jgi:predicted TIM-barrel fold metal-dependent hydrolase
MKQYFPFDPNPRKPAAYPPKNSCDCQFHVFGSLEQYPIRPNAAYVMPSATFAEAMKMHRTLGITRGIIVQPTSYGADNQALLDALAQAGPGYKGCTIGAVLTECDDSYIAKLDKAGIRGARFNFLEQVNLLPSSTGFDRAVARAKELGWYVKIQPGSKGILGSVSFYEHLTVPVVIDHMGRPNLEEGVNGPTVAKVIELLKKRNFWLMLSNGHKLSQTGHPWNDVLPIARAYIEAAPDRVIWSTDWPHPVSTTQPPNDADILELLYRYAPSEAEQQKILVDNPAALFGF